MSTQAVLDVNPRWASAPGATIRKVMDSRGLSTEDLASALGVNSAEALRLLDGAAPITDLMAEELARLLGSTAHFWSSREAHYRESLTWLEADYLVQRSPMPDMVHKGWIEAADGWMDQARLLLDFYGVSDADEWTETWAPRLKETRFRTSPTFASEDLAVAAWLRQVEREVHDQTLAEWDPDRLRLLIPKIRRLTTTRNPARYLPLLRAILASSGVALVVLPATKGNKLSGAAFTLDDGHRVIGLTGRHLAEDHLWFTLFHEIGHLLLHADQSEFLDAFDADESASTTEAEANEFARTMLIPGGLSELSQEEPRMREVVAFAASKGIAPGIVVGQLHHAGILEYNQLRSLIRRYKWEGSTLKI